MVETQSLSSLNEIINTLSLATDQHDQELHIIHQKLHAVTSCKELILY